MPCSWAMRQRSAASTAPPRWTWSSVSSSPRGCGVLLAALLSSWRAADAAAPAGRRAALGVVAPHDVAVVVGRRDEHQAVPDLGAPELLLGDLPGDGALEHDVAVVGGPGDAPAVLREEVDHAGDLRQPLGRVLDELTEPARVRALATVRPVELVAKRAERVDQDIGGHQMLRIN